MKKIGLLSIGAFVPEQKLTNADLEKMVDTQDAWIVQRTGIRERRIAPKGMQASDMSVEAARACLRGRDVRPDLLIASCGTAEASSPFQASIIANRLGLEGLAALDINVLCSGLVYGLTIAADMLRAGDRRYALVTAGEKMSMFTNYQDRRSCILFGDGAAAILLATEGWEHELIASEIGCTPSGSDLVKMGAREGDPYFWQDGQKVFKFGVNIIGELTERLKKKAGITEADRYFIIPHQANLRMIQAVADHRGIPMERFVMNIERYGNTSSASIGLALEEAWREGRFQKGDAVFLIGFGGGLGWGGVALRW